MKHIIRNPKFINALILAGWVGAIYMAYLVIPYLSKAGY